ncbi:hypothetical protein DOE60_16415 [Salmonella enterica subsp. salamae serovar 56:z10:e,n,x]|nr:hypothetical protein DOE60_16415 [Salmonella enterica subsp. salamae serovar 56:z10:e,n,x]
MGGFCPYRFYNSASFVGGIIPVGRISRSHPPGRCCATCKSAPGGFVLLRRALTDRLQIKQKALSCDRALRFI